MSHNHLLHLIVLSFEHVLNNHISYVITTHINNNEQEKIFPGEKCGYCERTMYDCIYVTRDQKLLFLVKHMPIVVRYVLLLDFEQQKIRLVINMDGVTYSS